jgi:hypothetical protein
MVPVLIVVGLALAFPLIVRAISHGDVAASSFALPGLLMALGLRALWYRYRPRLGGAPAWPSLRSVAAPTPGSGRMQLTDWLRALARTAQVRGGGAC